MPDHKLTPAQVRVLRLLATGPDEPKPIRGALTVSADALCRRGLASPWELREQLWDYPPDTRTPPRPYYYWLTPTGRQWAGVVRATSRGAAAPEETTDA